MVRSVWAVVRGCLEDIKYAGRQIRRTPTYAGFVVLVLALGIGTVTAMFTVLYAVLLKPLPFAGAGALYQPLEKTREGSEAAGVSYREYRGWQEGTRATADVAFSRGGLNIVDGPAGAVLMTEVKASANLFAVLGAHPALGRGFSAEESAGGAEVVVLSDALWRQEFGADPGVLGRTVRMGGNARTVVGVMPSGFFYPLWEERPQAWTPMDAAELNATNGDAYAALTPMVRVHGGVPRGDVEAQLTRIHGEFTRQKEAGIRLEGLRASLAGDSRPAMLALGAAAGLVWLIACSNVAGLMLARVMGRRNEVAVRAALGAGRRRIVLQFLMEGFVLASVGAAAGLGLAMLLLSAFRHLLAEKLPFAAGMELDWRVFAGLGVLTLLTAVAFATAPALLAGRTDIHAGLKSGSRTQAGDRGSNRARSVLLVGQVALSVALLIGAGLMMRTVYALRHAPLGFRTDHLITTSLTVPNDLYGDRNVGVAVWQPLLEAIRRMPGVRAAALSTVLPIQHPVELMALIDRTQWMRDDEGAVARAATPGLMEALGVQLRAGRFFTAEDRAGSLPVAVVNQAFAERFLGGRNVVGKVFRYGHAHSAATVVGVMEDVRQDSVGEASVPEFYLPMAQLGPAQQIYRALLGRFMQVAVRTETTPAAMVPALRAGIRAANPHLAVGTCATMAEAVEDSLGAENLVARVTAVFGGLVLLITLTGLHGLLNYLVAQRTQEIGIRMALGAERADVVAMILRRALVLLVIGTLGGVALALLGGRLLERFLYGVRATDGWTIALTCAGLLVCGVGAALMPTRRAATISPVEALRAD